MAFTPVAVTNGLETATATNADDLNQFLFDGWWRADGVGVSIVDSFDGSIAKRIENPASATRARLSDLYTSLGVGISPEQMAAHPALEEAFGSIAESAINARDLTKVTVDGVQQDVLAIESTPVTSEDLGIVGPSVPVPPSALFATVAAVAWPTANNANFQRFTVPTTRAYRYLNVGITVASGNVEVGIVALSGAGLRSYNRVVTTGIIPATVRDRFDVGPFVLPGGEYAFYVWADNTTLQTRLGTNSAVTASRLTTEHGSYPGGIPASGAISSWGGSRYIAGCSIEADV